MNAGTKGFLSPVRFLLLTPADISFGCCCLFVPLKVHSALTVRLKPAGQILALTVTRHYSALSMCSGPAQDYGGDNCCNSQICKALYQQQ